MSQNKTLNLRPDTGLSLNRVFQMVFCILKGFICVVFDCVYQSTKYEFSLTLRIFRYFYTVIRVVEVALEKVNCKTRVQKIRKLKISMVTLGLIY